MPALIDGTIFSVVLCILAGIALRYALYYGREALSEKQPHPRKQAAAASAGADDEFGERTKILHDALEREQSAQVRLRRDVERLQDEFFQVQRENQDLRGEIDESRNELKVQEDQIEAIGRELDAQRRLVESERLHSSDLLEQLRTSNQTLDQVRQQDVTLSDLAEEVRRVTRERDEFRIQLDTAHAGVENQLELNAHLQHALERLEGEIDRLSADARFADDVRNQNVALQELLHDSKEQVRALQDNRDELRGKFEMASQAIEEFRSENQRWRQRAEQLHVELDQAHNRLGEFAQRERQGDQTRLELEEQIRMANVELQNLNVQQGQWIQEGQEHLESIGRDHQTELRVARQQLLATVEDKQQELDDLRSEMARRLEENQRLLVELDRLQHVDTTILDKERYVATITQERDTTRRAYEEALERIEHLETSVREADGKIRYHATEKDELVLGLQREKESRQALQGTTTTLQDRLRLLESDSIELTTVRSRLQNTDHDLQAIRNELGLLTSERDELKIALARAERRLETVEAELLRSQGDLSRRESAARQLRIEKEEALTHLERERNERGLMERKLRLHTQTIEKLTADSRSLESLLERQRALQSSLSAHTLRLSANSGENATADPLATERVASEALGVADVVNFSADRNRPRDERGELVRDSRRGLIYTKPPRFHDDLKRIVGVGEIIESQLHELGIFTFEQIMQWDAVAVQAISQELAFKDRIDREQWIKQAARLHREGQRKAA